MAGKFESETEAERGIGCDSMQSGLHRHSLIQSNHSDLKQTRVASNGVLSATVPAVVVFAVGANPSVKVPQQLGRPAVRLLLHPADSKSLLR